MDFDLARRYLQEAGIDAIVATSPENVLYTSSSFVYMVLLVRDRMAFTIIPAQGEPVYIVAEMEKNLAETMSTIPDLRTYIEFQDYPMDTLIGVLREKGLGDKRIAIERTHLPGYHEEYLRTALPKTELVEAKPIFDRLRMIKSPREIELLERAATATRLAIEEAFMAARPGDSEKDVADHIGRRVLEQGAEIIHYITVKTGERFFIANQMTGHATLQPGHLLWCDVGTLWSGYFSDVARTYVLGEPTREQAENYRNLASVYREVVRNVTVGTPLSRLYQICKEGFEATSAPLTMAHIGHSLGVELHEHPMVSPLETGVVRENMVLSLEPGYVRDGMMVHVEDLILATPAGPRVLTGSLAPEEIPIIPC